MPIACILAFAAGGACVVMAGAVLLYRARSWSKWFFAVGLLALAAEAVFLGLSLNAADAAKLLGWQRWHLLPMALVPGIWLTFSLCYARGNYQQFLRKWRWAAAALLVIPLVLVPFTDRVLVGRMGNAGRGDWFVGFGWPGIAMNLVVLLGSVLILMNLERTFRTAIGVMRWRIKYMVLGLALVFGVKVYTSSQSLLYSGLDATFAVIQITALLIALPLIALALVRTRLGEADVYPSQAVLQHSITAVLVGIYLLVTGVLAKVVTAYGGDALFPLKSLLILIALVGLSMLLFSDRIRQRTSRWISRHFQRPLYDYRKAWSLFTERTTSLVEETSLCRAVVKLVSETFNLLSVTIWLVDEQRQKLAFAASSILAPTSAQPLEFQNPQVAEMVRELALKPEPIDLDQSKASWSAALQDCDPDFFQKGGNRVCMPLVSNGQLLGLITIADRVSGFRFSLEDFDLLKCIGDQVAASLSNIRMGQRLMQAKQMEAFQNMAAFFVHDLKNTASTLSLILQNMSAHFGDPAFQEDALRGLSRSVNHLNDLIKRLTALRENLESKKTETELNQLVSRVTSVLEGAPGIKLVKELAPLPKMLVDPDQISKLVTNLALNAKEAVGTGGEIRVATTQDNSWAVLSVSDNGCGMSPEFMAQRLFKPFQTTKKQGLGIGMLHCKMIVDAHQGKIEVESQEGKGTTFRVFLPTQARIE